MTFSSRLDHDAKKCLSQDDLDWRWQMYIPENYPELVRTAHHDFVPSSDPFHALDSFREMVRNIGEADEGDFMRKANHYLLTLMKNLKVDAPGVADRLNEMHLYTQLTPLWQNEPTRERLLLDADRIEGLIWDYTTGENLTH